MCLSCQVSDWEAEYHGCDVLETGQMDLEAQRLSVRRWGFPQQHSLGRTGPVLRRRAAWWGHSAARCAGEVSVPKELPS